MSKLVLELRNLMRLKNIYLLCKRRYNDISNFSITFINKELGYKVEQWLGCYVSLQELKHIDVLEKEISAWCEAIPTISREKNSFSISVKVRDAIVPHQTEVLNKMKTIISLYESMNLAECESVGLDIKIPPTDNLSEYISYLRELEFILTQCPLLKVPDSELKFESVDVGSNWIILGVVGSIIILNHVAVLLDKAVILKSHLLSLREQEELLKTSKNKNQLLDEEIKVFSDLKTIYMNQLVAELETECEFQHSDGEERGKTEKSLEKLSSLLDKGLEIYSSIETPKEIQVLFPPIGEKSLISEKDLKLLLDKKEDDITT